MFGCFPSQNSAWQNFLKFPVSLHFRVTEPNWSISHEMEDLSLAEITAAFPRHVRNFPPCCAMPLSNATATVGWFSVRNLQWRRVGTATNTLLDCSHKQKGGCNHRARRASGTLHDQVLPRRSVPFTLLSFHFLLLITFALIWVFGRRINEK